MLLQIVGRGIGPLHLGRRGIWWRTELDWGPARSEQTIVKYFLIIKRQDSKGRHNAGWEVSTSQMQAKYDSSTYI